MNFHLIAAHIFAAILKLVRTVGKGRLPGKPAPRKKHGGAVSAPPAVPPAIPPPFNPGEYSARILRRIAAELRARRRARGISAYALAVDAQVSDQTILNIEQGLTKPNFLTVSLICARF